MRPQKIQQTLEAALGDHSGQRRAVMFSGGFDSLLIAVLAKAGGAQVTAVTVQFDEFNPLTVAGSIEFAKKAGIGLHILHVKPVEFLSAYEALIELIDGPYQDLDLAVVYAALKKYDQKIAGDVFISGMGADQWFGNEALAASAEDITLRLQRVKKDVDDHQQVAEIFGCKFIFPFLSGPMLALSRSIAPAMKKDKKLLRAMAVAQGIPHCTAKSEIQVPTVMRNILIRQGLLSV